MDYDRSTTTSFSFPTIYQFPPFFTRQVNERTWHSQLVNWNSLILAYCRYYRIFTLDLSRSSISFNSASINNFQQQQQSSDQRSYKPRGEIDGELFRNPKINRALQTETIQAIFEYMVGQGTAAWLDSSKTKDFDDSESEDRFEQIFSSFSMNFGSGNNDSSPLSGINKKSSILVYWRHPQEWASLISEWVDSTGQNGSVLTLYELVEGDTTGNYEFRDLHPAILRAAIDILVQRGKAVIMKGPDSRVAGVKML